MEGPDHGLAGAAAWLGVAPLLGLSPALSPARLGAGAIVAAGAALLPDWDHPSATPARTFPLGPQLARGVKRLSGGHRHATHGLGFAAASLGLSWWLAGRQWPSLVLAGGCCALAFHLVERGRLAGLLAAAAASGAIWHWVPLGRWLAVAVALGVTSHIAADCLNPEGCPLLWPLGRRFRLPLCSTGSAGEAWFSGLLLAGVAALLWLRLGPAIQLAARR